MKTPLPHVLFTTVVVVLFLDMDDDRSVRLLRLVCDLVLCPVALKQSLVMVQFLSDHLHRSRMVKIFFQLEMDGLQQASGFDSFHGKFPPDVDGYPQVSDGIVSGNPSFWRIYAPISSVPRFRANENSWAMMDSAFFRILASVCVSPCFPSLDFR